MKEIIIIGAGGVGRETAMLIEQINKVGPQWKLLGFVDDNETLHGTFVNHYKVLGNIQSLQDYKNIYAICSISDTKIKKKILGDIPREVEFATLIHPSVIMGPECRIGKGVLLQANCVITTNVTIGDHVQVNPQCGIGHDSTIHDYCSLYWNVSISGNVAVEEGCTIGTKATIIQGLRIGGWTTLGSAANVIRNIPAGCTAVGNPAKVIKERG